MSNNFEVTKRIIVIILTAIISVIFFGMGVQVGNFYLSDTPAHIQMGIESNVYSLESIVIMLMGKISSFPFIQLLFALYETLLVVLTWEATQKFINDYFPLNKWYSLLISTALLFFCDIYIPFFYPYYYRFSLGTQPWHNSTYFGMRLFGIVFLYLFYRLLSKYKDGIRFTEWLGCAIALALSTAVKPNFLFAVCLSLALFLLIDLIKEKTLKVFKNVVILGTVVFPSLFVLLIQYLLVYGKGALANENSSGIALVWTSDWVWEGSATHMAIKFLRAFIFPLLIVIISYYSDKMKSVDKKSFAFSILLYFFAICVSSLFDETGARAAHGNFTWGVPVTCYTMYMYLVPVFFTYMKQYFKGKVIKGKKIMNICFVLGIIVLFLQFTSGVTYFYEIMKGEFYWS